MSNRLNSEKMTRYDKHPQDQCVIPSIQKARTLLVSTFFPRRFLFPALASKFGFGWIWHHSSKTNSPSYLHQIAATQIFCFHMICLPHVALVWPACSSYFTGRSLKAVKILQASSGQGLRASLSQMLCCIKEHSNTIFLHNGHNATWKSSKQLSLHIEGEIECSGPVAMIFLRQLKKSAYGSL